MLLLLFGGTGQVGEEFRRLTLPRDTEVVAPGRDEVDFAKSETIARMVASRPWDAVVNAAAYTEVDRAEAEEALATVINGEAPSVLAAETNRHGIPLVHISTDYVFDGRKGAPYVETDPVAPLSAYGRSKLAGEEGVRKNNPRHVILRSCWVYSPYRKNFVKTILRLAGERDKLTIVDDQRGCPTSAHDIAQTCYDIAVRCALDPASPPYGTYNFAAQGEATWFDFAKAILDLGKDQLKRTPQVVPIRTEDYPTPAKRPADSRLDCTAINRAFGITPRPWREALAETMTQLAANRSVA